MSLDHNKYTKFLIHSIAFIAFLKDKSFSIATLNGGSAILIKFLYL